MTADAITSASNPPRSWVSNLGLLLCLLTTAILICNQYGSISALDPYYRINTPALCLIFGFVTACFGTRLAIAGCVLALPLLPTFSWQLQIYTGYGRVQDVAGAGLDLIAGILLGLIANCAWRKRSLFNRLTLPWPAAVFMIILTISVIVAIARNLHQSASPFAAQALLYNLTHLRTLGWHDDYRPLLDWVTYGVGFLLLAIFVPALKSTPRRNDIIFLPLMVGLIIAAVVGLRQSVLGVGLNVSQLTFRQGPFGYLALGFQPDVHAFAAHMLIGAIGLLGYLYTKKNAWLSLLVIGGLIPMCALMMFLSKSKSTVVVALFYVVVIVTIWMFRRTKYFKPALLTISLVSLALGLTMLAFPDLWIDLFRFGLQKLSLPDLGILNLKLSYRPEVYLAAVRMFGLFPFAGLGQSEFYHQSANHALTNSLFLSYEQNGEHVHNYFLQLLVENGVLGFAAFMLLFAYPVFRATNKYLLIPGGVALIAVFGGNFFSHSMLVRENLLLAFCFLALMYSVIPAEKIPPIIQSSWSAGGNSSIRSIWSRFFVGLRQPKMLLALALVATLWVAKEAYQSFKVDVFNQDIQCHDKPRLERDGWTSGRYLFDVPVGAVGVRFNLATTQPDVAAHPLPGALTVWFDRRELLVKDFSLTKTGPQTIEIDLPGGKFATPDDYQIELRVARCFVPRNFGMSSDARRLGVRIDSIEWK